MVALNSSLQRIVTGAATGDSGRYGGILMFVLTNCSRLVARFMLCCALFALTMLLPGLKAAQLTDPIWQGTVNYNVFASASFRTSAESENALLLLLSGVSLSASPSPVLVGTPIKLTATPRGGSSVEYQFFHRLKSGWESLTGGKYLAAKTCSYTPSASGAQLFRVNAREVGSTKYFPGEATVTVCVPLNGVTLNATPSPVLVNTPIQLIATASGGASLEYQFYRRLSSGWESLTGGRYLSAKTCSYTPSFSGAQLFRVNAREVGTTKYLPGEVTITVCVPLDGVKLNATPSPAPFGKAIKLTATPSGGASVEYQFFRRLSSSWESLTGDKYLASPICSYTPTVSGTQLFRVNVREVGAKQYYPGEVTVSVSLTYNLNNPTDGAAMVWVFGGTFTMGTPYNAWWNEPYTQRVTLSGYWMYKYEVKVAQYRAFCADTGHALPDWPGNDLSWAGKTGWADPLIQQHPIVNVSWHDAKAYADWAGVRLPTEAQWEYAARGVDGRNFPWGGTATVDDPNNGRDETKCANYNNSFVVGKSTWPVGSFPTGTSWCGVLDMAGNVWEWCADWSGGYSFTPVTNPTGPVSGDCRVVRGGSWFSVVSFSRGAFRDFYLPTDYISYGGFRCISLTPVP